MSNLINLGDLGTIRGSGFSVLETQSSIYVNWDLDRQRVLLGSRGSVTSSHNLFEKSGPLLNMVDAYSSLDRTITLLIHPNDTTRVFGYANNGIQYTIRENPRTWISSSRTYTYAKWSYSGNFIAATRPGIGLAILPNSDLNFTEFTISNTELNGQHVILSWHPKLDYLIYGNVNENTSAIHFGILKIIPGTNNNISYIKIPITNPEPNMLARGMGWSPDGNYIITDNANLSESNGSISNVAVYKFDAINDTASRIMTNIGFEGEVRISPNINLGAVQILENWTPDGKYIKFYQGIYKWENERFTFLPNALSTSDKISNGYWFNNGKNYISSTAVNANMYWIKDEVYTYFDNISSININNKYNAYASPSSSNILIPYTLIRLGTTYHRVANVAINDYGTVDWSSDTRYIVKGLIGTPYIGVYKFDRNDYETTLLTNVGVTFTRAPVVAKWSTDALFLVIGYYTAPYLEMYRWNQPTEKFIKIELNPDILPTSQPTDIIWSQDGLAFVVITAETPYAFFYETTADPEIDIFNDLEDMIAISDNPRFRGISIAEGEIPKDLQIIMKTLIK